MSLALILSSYVAVGRIGGGAQQLALAALGLDPVLVPTVMFGASPAKGGRGRATDPELFQQLIDGVESQGALDRADLVITGHFSLPEQVAMACETIGKVRRANPNTLVVVDPVLGDAPKGLYVKPEVAAAVARDLVPLADWITPNLWELSHLSGRDLATAAEIADAARALSKPALVTSAPGRDGEIGLICCAPDHTTLFAHPRMDPAPNGTGDLVTALFAAGLVQGLEPAAAAERAARTVAHALSSADALGLPPLSQDLVRDAPAVRIERLV